MARISLIVNPRASRVTRRRIETAAAGLQAEHKVDLERTEAPGHATQLARDAVTDGAEAIVVLGGDGTVSEALPALAGGPVPLGVIPGGGTNVLARSLGVPESPRQAVTHLLRALVLGPRPIGLGQAADRLFGFVAGIGFDGATVRRVERRRRWKRPLGDALYVISATAAFTRFDRRQPALSLHLPDGSELDGIFHLMVLNSSAYTYFGPRALTLVPGTHVNQPLAVAAFRKMTLPFTLHMLGSALFEGRALARSRDVVVMTDLPALSVRSTQDLDMQLDGEYGGTSSGVDFSYVPGGVLFLA